jgi:hypothetical protein
VQEEPTAVTVMLLDRAAILYSRGLLTTSNVSHHGITPDAILFYAAQRVEHAVGSLFVPTSLSLPFPNRPGMPAIPSRCGYGS